MFSRVKFIVPKLKPVFRVAVTGVKSFPQPQPISSSFSINWKSFATYKTSTGLAGLAVDVHGRETLASLARQVLQNVKKIPETSQYRIDVEKIFNWILRTCEENEDILSIEREINRGQIEEVIIMAKDELNLVEYYYENKIWELVEDAQRTADEMIEKYADAIAFTNPEAIPKPPEQPKK